DPAVERLPRDPLRRDTNARAGIVVGKDIAIPPPIGTHLLGTALAQSHAMSRARAVEAHPSVRGLDRVAIAAQRVPPQFTADGKAERAGADEPGLAASGQQQRPRATRGRAIGNRDPLEYLRGSQPRALQNPCDFRRPRVPLPARLAAACAVLIGAALQVG